MLLTCLYLVLVNFVEAVLGEVLFRANGISTATLKYIFVLKESLKMFEYKNQPFLLPGSIVLKSWARDCPGKETRVLTGILQCVPKGRHQREALDLASRD